jgi:arsenate reductase-like glutaredoxin family protein
LQKEIEIEERDFFKERFSLNEIEKLLQGQAASEMFNFKSPSFKKIEKEKETLLEDELIELMLEEPRLVRRPVVRIDGKVYFGANQALLERLIG